MGMGVDFPKANPLTVFHATGIYERRKINIKYSIDIVFSIMVFSFVYIRITSVSNYIISEPS